MRAAISNIDRRVIFVLIAVVVAVPLVFPVKFKEIPSPIVKHLYDKIESLHPGSKVLFACDYDPPSQPELQPMTNAMVRHLCERKAKIFFITLWAPGPKMIEESIEKIVKAEFPDYEYGEDYMTLGYKPGNEGAIAIARSDLKQLWTTDGHGANIDEVPLTKPIRNLKSFNLIISVSSGYPGAKEWVQYGSDPANVPLVAGLTAVQTPTNYPYYPRQILGILGGIKGAAEYEAALIDGYPKFGDPKYSWQAQSRMGPQTFAHLAIVALIVIGNITFFIERRSRR